MYTRATIQIPTSKTRKDLVSELFLSAFAFKTWRSFSFAKKKKKGLILFTEPNMYPLKQKHVSKLMSTIKISPFHPDWATKGAHVHLGNEEFTLKPAHNGMIAITPTFGLPKNKFFVPMAEMIAQLLEHKPFRNRLINATQNAINTFGSSSNELEVDASFQLYFLEKALAKY
jgi:hypothetical protein